MDNGWMDGWIQIRDAYAMNVRMPSLNGRPPAAAANTFEEKEVEKYATQIIDWRVIRAAVRHPISCSHKNAPAIDRCVQARRRFSCVSRKCGSLLSVALAIAGLIGFVEVNFDDLLTSTRYMSCSNC